MYRLDCCLTGYILQMTGNRLTAAVPVCKIHGQQQQQQLYYYPFSLALSFNVLAKYAL